MPKLLEVQHRFVDDIPRNIEPGVLYISVTDATAKHKCCCGCGYSVVTPISPTDWQLLFDGKTVSLDPSIGNWKYSCRSHYFIRRNKVVWAGRMTIAQISRIREHDKRAKADFFGQPADTASSEVIEGEQDTILDRVRRWLK